MGSWDPRHGEKLPCEGAAVLCHRDRGCATGTRAVPQGLGLCHRDGGHAGIGIPAAGWCWKPSQGLVLEAQLGASTGIPAWVWCWKLSWMPVLGSQLGDGVGIPARGWCWKPSWVSALGSQLGTGVGSPAGRQWCVSDQRLQRWRKKNPNSEPSILSQYLPIPKKLATLK